MNESHFKIPRKCQSKFDCLVFEMLYIKKFKPNLNVQADSMHAKLCLTCNFCDCLRHLLFFIVFTEPSFYAVFDFIMTLYGNVETSSILNHLFSFSKP